MTGRLLVPNILVASLLLMWSPAVGAEGDVKPAEGPQKVVHRIVGLFAPEREETLRKTMEKIEGVKLVSLDFDHAEATFEYEAAKTFPNHKPEQIIERLNEWVRNNSNQTLGVKAACTVPRDKLSRIEIAVGLLDCDACCLAVHEILAQQEGVEQAAVTKKTGRVSVLIDPAKTEKAKLEKALTEREVTVLPP